MHSVFNVIKKFFRNNPTRLDFKCKLMVKYFILVGLEIVLLSKIGTGVVYIGGTPKDVYISMNVPTRVSLRIGLQSFLINRM